MPTDRELTDGTVGPYAAGLRLGSWTEADLPALVEAYRDPVLRRFSSARVRSAADARRWLARQREGWADGTRLGFAVREELPDGGPGRVLGHVVLRRVTPEADIGEVGYWTAGWARGRGVASRALDGLSRWGFDALGLRRLDLIHQVDNPASCRVAGKAGYDLVRVLPPEPPYPLDGHLHSRPA
ncbi:GNAT family N-acetyltransferase [Plantactinospora siamensis]|uniref:GNAT family N-acetyltransferase n=1 Tax=Plantactinospora siamensis TaxID=555372 RepID=A0ABV6NYM3_9ACTN